MTAARLPTLDGLRGLAVMGILLMNVVSFALPSGAYFNPAATGAPSPADLAVWAVSFVLVDGKMRALFSILFGASTLIVVTRAAEGGRDPARVHGARMATLALFGAAHGVLLWPGDILLHYALVGMLALPFTQLGARRQVQIALLLILAQAAIQASLLLADVQLRAAAALPGASPDTLAQWHALAAGIGVGRPRAMMGEIALHRGGGLGLVVANARALVAGAPFLLVFDGPETLAYMLIGMAALASGFLTGGWRRARYAQAAALAIGVGLPLEALLAALAARSGFDTLATFAAATLGGVPLRPLLALGYAAAAMPWLEGDGPLRRRVRAVGRMAFSNYLLTSLSFCLIFDGWGLGLFAGLPRAALYLLVPPTWLAMLAWSAPWLRRFRHGPLEAAWRVAARGFTK